MLFMLRNIANVQTLSESLKMRFLIRVALLATMLYPLGGCLDSTSPCVSITRGAYGRTGDFDADYGGGFQGRSMTIAWVDEARDGDHVPRAILVSAKDGFFELSLPAGPQILCIGLGDSTSFQVSSADERCTTINVQGLESWSYVSDNDSGWWQDYGPAIAVCD